MRITLALLIVLHAITMNGMESGRDPEDSRSNEVIPQIMQPQQPIINPPVDYKKRDRLLYISLSFIILNTISSIFSMTGVENMHSAYMNCNKNITSCNTTSKDHLNTGLITSTLGTGFSVVCCTAVFATAYKLWRLNN